MKKVVADAEHLAVTLGDDAVHRFAGVEKPAPGGLRHLVGQCRRAGALIERVVLVPQRLPCVVILRLHRANGRGRSVFSSFLHFETRLPHGIGRVSPEATIFTKRAEFRLARSPSCIRTLTPASERVRRIHGDRRILTICAIPTRASSVPIGVRITLKRGDPFRKLLGADWNKTHWFGTAAERDAALIEMARKHEYSRPGDKPGAEVRQGREAAREPRPVGPQPSSLSTHGRRRFGGVFRRAASAVKKSGPGTGSTPSRLLRRSRWRSTPGLTRCRGR